MEVSSARCANASVVLHVAGELATSALHQFRLRHLTAVRGVNLKRLDRGSGGEEDDVLYLTLHDPSDPDLPADHSKPVLQTAPKVGPNPVWNFSDLVVPDSLLASEEIIVRIWLVESPLDASGRVVCSYHVHFRSLVSVDAVLAKLSQDASQAVGTMKTAFLDNTLCFSIHRTLLVAPCCVADPALRMTERWKKWTDASWPVGEIQRSYSISSACRLRALGRAVREMKQDREEVLKELEYMDDAECERRRVAEQLDSIRVRVEILRAAKERLTASLRAKRQQKDVLEEKNSDSGWVLMSRYQDLNRDRERMRELALPAWAETRNNLLAAQVQLGMKRRELLSHLTSVYPITKGEDGKFQICGVHLPNGEDYAGHDDVRLAVAFGFVTHLCELISFVVNVPLRYQTDFRGSRSSVSNHASLATAGIRDNVVPLYERRTNKMKFEYAAYLTNLNVAHLRSLCGLGTPDLRQTLANLASLVNEVTPKKVPLRADAELREGLSLTPNFAVPESDIEDDGRRGAASATGYRERAALAGVKSTWRRFPWGGSHPNMAAMSAALSSSSTSSSLSSSSSSAKDGRFHLHPLHNHYHVHVQHQHSGLMQARARGLIGLGVNLLPPPHPSAVSAAIFNPLVKKSHARSVSLEERQCRALVLTSSLRPAGDCLGVECGTEVTESAPSAPTMTIQTTTTSRLSDESCDNSTGCDTDRKFVENETSEKKVQGRNEGGVGDAGAAARVVYAQLNGVASAPGHDGPSHA